MDTNGTTALVERDSPLGDIFQLSTSLRRLSDLYHDPEEYEPGFERPTAEAYDFTWRLLSQAAQLSRPNGIEAFPSTVGDGGIVVVFLGGNTSLRLVVPPPVVGAYVYSDGRLHAAEAAVLSELLLAVAA